MNVQWIEKFKISLINREFKTISKLLDDIPNLDKSNITEVVALINEALKVANDEKSKTDTILKKIKKQSAFLSHPQDRRKFSITS